MANAIIAYASNADNLSALDEGIALMAHKHVSFNIVPEQYPIVGECILEAIKDVLGNSATDEIMKAWTEGYQFLAQLLIDIEDKLKRENAAKKGGWHGYKTLVVTKKIQESNDIMSFHLQSNDGKPMPEFKPGQYLSFRIPNGDLPGFDHDIVRNYSLSSAPGINYYRVSIKKETSTDMIHPDGIVSNYFHDKVNVGTEVQVGMPCGSFVLKENSNHPIVLIAGGVGLTPMVSMLDSLLAKPNDHRKVVFIQCAKNPESHAMRDHVDTVSNPSSSNKKITSHVFYTNDDSGSTLPPLKYTKVYHNRLTAATLKEVVPSPVKNNEFYFCGPPFFLGYVRTMLLELDVPKSQVNYEYFGPTQQ